MSSDRHTSDPTLVKNPALVVWTEEPLNAETPLELLCRSPVTPTELFYVRNHGPVPELDPGAYRLAVDGHVREPLGLSLRDLARFERVTLEAALTCAGNRRAELDAVTPIPGQVPWGAGATGNAVWGGVRLRDVLHAAEPERETGHVAFTGADVADEDGETVTFGGSIPLERALAADVLLADEMNGQTLPALHGFPLRVVVPGYIGARSVKWLTSVTVAAEPSDNYFQARGYRLLPPETASGGAAHERGFALGELPVNAVVCSPRQGEAVRETRVTARGYALSGGARRVERVEVTVDGGTTFVPAELAHGAGAAGWTLWEAHVDVPAGACELAVRAFDSAAATQPESAPPLWNRKGYVCNAWHRVRFTAGA